MSIYIAGQKSMQLFRDDWQTLFDFDYSFMCAFCAEKAVKSIICLKCNISGRKMYYCCVDVFRIC